MSHPSSRILRHNSVVLALLAASASPALMAQTATPAADQSASAEKTLPQVTVRSKYEREDLPTRAPGNKYAQKAKQGIKKAKDKVETPVNL